MADLGAIDRSSHDSLRGDDEYLDRDTDPGHH